MKIRIFLITVLFILSCGVAMASKAPKSKTKSKFYDFGAQVIDGEIRKPTALYTTARNQAKFDRLLKLKKSFLPNLFATAKNKVFK
jgi:hypothetical protein